MVLGRSSLVFIWSLGFQVQYLSFPVQYQERDCGSWPSPRESSPHNSLLCNQQTPANTKPNTKAFIQIQNYQNTNRQTGTVSLHILLKECFDFCRFRWLMITALKTHCTQQLNIIIEPDTIDNQPGRNISQIRIFWGPQLNWQHLAIIFLSGKVAKVDVL